MYILEDFNKRHYMSNARSVTVSTIKLGRPSQIFSFSGEPSVLDCGYILTDESVLEEIFTAKELRRVLKLCEKKLNQNKTNQANQNTNNLKHCSAGKDPLFKSKTPIFTDNEEFKCLYP
jgi:hypothetical protein